jgi:hypothetical protein
MATMTFLKDSPQLATIFALATLQAFAQGGTGRSIQKASYPAPENDSMRSLIKAFTGSWTLHLSSNGSEGGVSGDAGSGEENWRAGPGSNSLIEDYHSTGTEGEIGGHGIFWHEGSEKGFRVFWCDNTSPVACRTLSSKADWSEGRLVMSEERYEKGKKHIFQETFAFDTPDSFTQTLSRGEWTCPHF